MKSVRPGELVLLRRSYGWEQGIVKEVSDNLLWISWGTKNYWRSRSRGTPWVQAVALNSDQWKRVAGPYLDKKQWKKMRKSLQKAERKEETRQLLQQEEEELYRRYCVPKDAQPKPEDNPPQPQYTFSWAAYYARRKNDRYLKPSPGGSAYNLEAIKRYIARKESQERTAADDGRERNIIFEGKRYDENEFEELMERRKRWIKEWEEWAKEDSKRMREELLSMVADSYTEEEELQWQNLMKMSEMDGSGPINLSSDFASSSSSSADSSTLPFQMGRRERKAAKRGAHNNNGWSIALKDGETVNIIDNATGTVRTEVGPQSLILSSTEEVFKSATSADYYALCTKGTDDEDPYGIKLDAGDQSERCAHAGSVFSSKNDDYENPYDIRMHHSANTNGIMYNAPTTANNNDDNALNNVNPFDVASYSSTSFATDPYSLPVHSYGVPVGSCDAYGYAPTDRTSHARDLNDNNHSKKAQQRRRQQQKYGVSLPSTDKGVAYSIDLSSITAQWEEERERDLQLRRKEVEEKERAALLALRSVETAKADKKELKKRNKMLAQQQPHYDHGLDVDHFDLASDVLANGGEGELGALFTRWESNDAVASPHTPVSPEAAAAPRVKEKGREKQRADHHQQATPRQGTDQPSWSKVAAAGHKAERTRRQQKRELKWEMRKEKRERFKNAQRKKAARQAS